MSREDTAPLAEWIAQQRDLHASVLLTYDKANEVIAALTSRSATPPKMSFVVETALVSARDYLMWLVELNGIRKGAVESVRALVARALEER